MDFRIGGYFVLLVICSVHIAAAAPGVSVKVKGLAATLDNGLIKLSLSTGSTIAELIKNGKNLVAHTKASGYFDWNSSHKNHKFSPKRLDVVTQSPERAHLKYSADIKGFLKLEYHVIMEKGLSGFYSYVKAENTNSKPVQFDEMRLVYRLNPQILNKISNGRREGTPPSEKELKKSKVIWDATWKLANGTVYSKYDYAGYLRRRNYQGAFGNGIGIWLISSSREYHAGGPLKQDLLVHHGPMILNYLAGRHFGTPITVTNKGWKKLYGPWLMYVNDGKDEQVKADVISRTKQEVGMWPYKWMKDPDYPLKRSTVTGKVDCPVRTMVILTSSLGEKFDLQVLGFSYSTETAKDGSFTLTNIRPGKHKLTAYPVEGFGIGSETEKEITVNEGNISASLQLSVPTKVIWSIGVANRLSDIYVYSKEERNFEWQHKPPAKLEFYVGKSQPQLNWYYAQTKPGTWSIKYQDKPNGKPRLLRIGFAGASSDASVTVSVNGKKMNEFQYPSDTTIYRCATNSGNFHAEAVNVPANVVKQGENVVDLSLKKGSVMYDSINFS